MQSTNRANVFLRLLSVKDVERQYAVVKPDHIKSVGAVVTLGSAVEPVDINSVRDNHFLSSLAPDDQTTASVHNFRCALLHFCIPDAEVDGLQAAMQMGLQVMLIVENFIADLGGHFLTQ